MNFCSSLSIDVAPGCVAELLTGLFQVSQTCRGRQVEELVHHEEACTGDRVTLMKSRPYCTRNDAPTWGKALALAGTNF